MKPREESFWTLMDRFPPILIRLLAKDQKTDRPLTTVEIASRTGLAPVIVEAISQGTGWDGVDIPTARLFLTACNADLTNPSTLKRINTYLRYKKNAKGTRIPTPFRYLKSSPLWDTYYRPLRDRWGQSLLERIESV